MSTVSLQHRAGLWRRRRSARERRVLRAWALAWLGGAGLGIANGVTRELTYADRVGDLTAHQMSTVTAVGLFAGYFSFLQRRWPLPNTNAALRVGALWLVLTVLFEFGFGHYVDRKPWSTLLRDYDITDGRLWALVLAWLATGPAVMRALDGRRS